MQFLTLFLSALGQNPLTFGRKCMNPSEQLTPSFPAEKGLKRQPSPSLVGSQSALPSDESTQTPSTGTLLSPVGRTLPPLPT